MITKGKLTVFKKYNGDGDDWARSGNAEFMSNEDWHLIEQLLADLRLISNGLASEGYAETTEHKLRTNCDSPSAMDTLREMAKTLV
jgi:hypothetical protein